MKVITEETRAEIEVKKSRFIAIAIPCDRMEDIKKEVQKVREENPGANHVVHAAVIGPKGTLFSSSDDKEPKNTAGRPALDVVKGSGITNILVLIVRYFGGTLLGTGGLVKAYSDSAKEVLKKVKTEELIERKEFSLSLSYENYNLVKRVMENYDVKDAEEHFETDIRISGKVDAAKYEDFLKEMENIGQGRILIRRV